MKLLRSIIVLSSSVAGLSMLGCEVDVHEHPTHHESVYVQEQDQVPAYVTVTEAPPTERIIDRRSAPPAREYVWIDGYYSWDGRHYVWQQGHWEMPPRSNARWVAPRYDRDEHGYRYTPGYWRAEARVDIH